MSAPDRIQGGDDDSMHLTRKELLHTYGNLCLSPQSLHQAKNRTYQSIGQYQFPLCLPCYSISRHMTTSMTVLEQWTYSLEINLPFGNCTAR